MTADDIDDIFDDWTREATLDGIQQACDELKQQYEEDLAESYVRGYVLGLLALYSARFDTVPDDVRAIIHRTRDEATFRAWIRLAATCGPEEIAAAVRAVSHRVGYPGTLAAG